MRATLALWIAPGLLALSHAASASAAPARARLAYLPSTSDCPSERELRDAVAIRLGYDPFDSEAAQRVVVRMSHDAGGWVAKVQLWASDTQLLGQRDLADPSGDGHAFAESVALAVSLSLDPLGLGKPAAPPPVAAPPPLPPKPPATPPQLVAQVGVLGAVGAAPSPNVGLDAQVELRWHRFSLGLGGRGDFPAGTTVAGESVTTSVLVGEVVPCVRWNRFAGCLLIIAGEQTAAGALEGTDAFGAGGARVAADFALAGPLAAQVALEVWSPVTRTNVTANGVPVWSTNPIEGSLLISLLYKVR